MDVDALGSDRGASCFLEWVQARSMEMEASKISQMMTELFRKCRPKADQPVREFNVLVLRLHEFVVNFQAWLSVDKLRLAEAEELALLASVGNEYDVRKLHQDRGFRRGNRETPGAPSARGRVDGGLDARVPTSRPLAMGQIRQREDQLRSRIPMMWQRGHGREPRYRLHCVPGGEGLVP